MTLKKAQATASGTRRTGQAVAAGKSSRTKGGVKEDALKYHHGNLRAALVEEALRQLAQQEGDALSLRGLATQVGVSVAAVYRHFSSKEALLAEVAADGFNRLSALFDRELPRRGDGPAQARFQRLGELYVEFALASPARYRLMFGQSGLKGFPALREAADRSFGYAVDAARGIVEEAQADSAWILPLAHAGWSMGHGYVHLALSHLLDRNGSPPDFSPALLTRFLQLPAEALEGKTPAQLSRAARRKGGA